MPRFSFLTAACLLFLSTGTASAQGTPFRDFRAELILAIEENNVGRARWVIRDGGEREINRGNPSPLVEAVRFDNVDMVALLLKSGGDPNATEDSPLKEAVRNDSINMVRLLFQTDARLRDEETADLLRITLRGTNAQSIFRELLNHGAETDLAFRIAVENRKREAALLCLERGADVSVLEDLDLLSLTDIEASEVPEIFQLAVREENREPALSYFLSTAAATGNQELAVLALAQGGTVSLDHLERAEAQGHDEMVLYLLERMDGDLSALIKRAREEERTALVEYLKGLRNDRIGSVVGPVAAGLAGLFVLVVVFFFLRKNILHSPKRLYQAVSKGDPKHVEKLLEAGAAPNTRYRGEPLLILAAKREKLKIARILLRHGADVHSAAPANAAEGAGMTALHIAASRGNIPLAELFLRSGAAVDGGSPGALPPLFLAAAAGHGDMASLLVERGADLKARINEQTLLFAAVVKRSPEAVRTLLEAGADPNGDDPRTPLHAAAAIGDAELVELLLSLDADPHAVDPEGRTPYDLALSRQHEEAARVLETSAPPPARSRGPEPPPTVAEAPPAFTGGEPGAPIGVPQPLPLTPAGPSPPVFETLIIPAPDPPDAS